VCSYSPEGEVGKRVVVKARAVIAVITVEPAVQFPFVLKGTQMRLVGQDHAIQGRMTH